MKPLCLVVVALWTFTLAGVAAETRNPFDVPDPLAETWWTDEEQMALFTNHILLDSKLAQSLADHLIVSKGPAGKRGGPDPQTTRQHLTSQPPYLLIPDFASFPRPTNDILRDLFGQMSRHTNVSLQFFALMCRAEGGDRSAAEAILKYPSRKDLSPGDINVLKNIFHGIGIDVLRDTPEFILEMAKRMSPRADGEVRERQKMPAGIAAPDFEIKTLDGKAIRLSDYRGKTVLLHFWSTTCGPCIGEFPQMTKALRPMLQRRKDLIVLAVSLDDNRKTIREAVKKYDLGDFTHLCDGRGWASVPARLYRITGIPSDVVIDSKGIIRADSWRQLEGLLGTVSEKK
ncbi:MAG TPA: TlpA disulfide reductase family protein [Methylomirabilota bacterium]|nr:TlpA disulfide reductase family protein [Methylomirabilota bacterium]